ncbi:conserved hypothetical protein [Verticillium alfalfae VaMs.102]|uniref:Uncharacterized protein n=1 Tax=Verticillium alfalfae (strain VaMs.102 / ATCC MYA-4576 / FGSC 10136) TaxID=526221 RepID=C9SID0_VERA1|nr:conserved hypothetical protein [Verticillium alfalfae VaMs.102]EEY18703.1 conserved hypothetical protein [Verticillium alfalfae VaMs.102]
MSDKVQMAQHEQPIEKRGKRKSCMRHCAKFWWIYLLAFIAIVVLAVCLIIFVAIPKIAQSKLDHAELTVDGIIVTKTEEDKFNMAINSTIRSKGGVKAKIAPFAAVMYLEDIESHIPFVHLDFPETESVKIQTVNTTQEVTIPDMDAFTTFNTWLLGNETLRVTVEGKTHVKVNGISRKYGVTFKKTMELTGLNHFKGLAVTSNRVNITHDDNGDNFFGWVDVPNPSVFTIEIGNASFHTYYNSMRANISTAPVVRAMSSEPSCDTGIVDFQLGGRDVFNNGEDLAYFGNALSASNLTVPIELATAFERDVGLTFEC